MLYVAGEDIGADQTVVVRKSDGLVYRSGPEPADCLGVAVERLREGFRVIAKDGEVREDDA